MDKQTFDEYFALLEAQRAAVMESLNGSFALGSKASLLVTLNDIHRQVLELATQRLATIQTRQQ